MNDEAGPKPVPHFSWSVAAATERGITARLVGYSGQFALFWGDGTNELAQGNSNLVKTKPYPAAGAYMLTAKKLDGSKDIIATGQVIVRDGTTPVGVTFAASANNPEKWEAVFSEVEPIEVLPRVRIDWGDDGTPDEVWAIPGQKVSRGLKPGTYIRTVRDLGTKRAVRTEYTVQAESYDPDGTFEKSPTAAGKMTVRFTVSKVSASKPLIVEWGDPVMPNGRIAAPKVGSYVEATYELADGYMPVARFEDGTGKPISGYVEVPFP